jgi:steroid delta-isomerase-like uncharacterized protein
MDQVLIDAAWAPNDAFNREDWEAFRAALADDAVYEEIGTGRTMQGADANLELARGWKTAFPDATGTINQAFVSGDTVILDITWTGTHNGPLPMPNGDVLPATGKPITMAAVMITRVADGKAVHQKHFLDLLSMLVQLGVIPR